MLCKVYLLGSIWTFGIKMLHFQEYNIKVMIDGIALKYGIKWHAPKLFKRPKSESHSEITKKEKSQSTFFNLQHF